MFSKLTGGLGTTGYGEFFSRSGVFAGAMNSGEKPISAGGTAKLLSVGSTSCASESAKTSATSRTRSFDVVETTDLEERGAVNLYAEPSDIVDHRRCLAAELAEFVRSDG